MGKGRVLIVGDRVRADRGGVRLGAVRPRRVACGLEPGRQGADHRQRRAARPRSGRRTSSPRWGAQIADTTLFSIDTGVTKRLLAYRADGSINCSGVPRTCSPIWTAPLTMSLYPDDARQGGFAVVDGRVYVAGFTPSSPGQWRLEVFDAQG